MARQSSRPFTVAPLQRIVAESIDDPVEQQRLDQLRKQQACTTKTEAVAQSGTRNQKLVASLLKQCEELTTEERSELLARLTTTLPSVEQLTLLGELLKRLSTEGIKEFETAVQSRLEKHSA